MHPEELTPSPSPTGKEQATPTELLGAANVGLQARLLLGDFSRSRVEITKEKFLPIQANGALGINDRAESIYQKASITQRNRYQEEKGLTYAQWRNGFNTYLDGIRNDTEHEEKKAFLLTLGIADTVTADDFYDEYLNGKSDIIKFVDDVETRASREQIIEHEEIIRQLGNAFGYESSEVIEHLIHGVRNVKTDIDAFVNEAKSKANTTEVATDPLLHKIQEDSGEEVQQEEPVEGTEEAAQKKAEPSAEAPPEAEAPPARPPGPETPVKKTIPAAKMATRKAVPHKTQEKIPEPPPEQKPTKKAEGPKEEKREEEKPKPTQVYPAPVEGGKRREQHLISPGEIDAAIKLLYNDVFRFRRSRERQVNLLKSSEITNNYARELYTMIQDYGRDFVFGKATNAVQILEKTIKDLGLKIDRHSKSKSWYLWGIAKSRFLANNPDIQRTLPNAEKYEPSDPLLHYRTGTHDLEGRKSRDAEEAVINGMVGWEVYRQKRKVRDIMLHLRTRLTHDDLLNLRSMLAQSPKRRGGTLSSYQLQEIGKLVRSNTQKK